MVLKFVWLKMLKTSPRSCSRYLSLKRTFLKSEKSKRFVGGPLMTPRGALPRVLDTGAAVGFGWMHEVLGVMSIHATKVCGAFALGSQRRFGRLPATSAGILPSQAASSFVVTVNGRPDCN